MATSIPSGAASNASPDFPQAPARRAHLTRLMSIWRSAGWPCRDAIELDLLAAGWVASLEDAQGRETLHLTEAGLNLLAHARQRNQRSLSAHDRLAERMAAHLATAGRLVWRELSLRAAVEAPVSTEAQRASAPPALPSEEPAAAPGLWVPTAEEASAAYALYPSRKAWRMARPDVFSVRHTSVEAYLQPMVHEVKVSRADLLSDLRHAAKRESYRWLCSECYYVFPAHIAKENEIPPDFGVWVLHGGVDGGVSTGMDDPADGSKLELVRPARSLGCKLPFVVWMALARSMPWSADGDSVQAPL